LLPWWPKGEVITAEDSEALRAEIEQLRAQIAQLWAGLEQAHSRRFVNRLVEATQGARTLRPEIAQLRTQLAEANQALEQEREEREAEVEELKAMLEQESSRGFFRRLFGLGPRPSEDTEQYRERMRGRLAVRLLWALLAVVVGTYAYIWISDLNPNELSTVVPMVGTTLLTPLVGLIGAVMGFYYGGQTAVQAASQTAEATRTAAQAATAVQNATAAQFTAQTAAQKATTPQQSAEAARTAVDMAAQTAANVANGTSGTKSSSIRHLRKFRQAL
jgi:hypothetical protein